MDEETVVTINQQDLHDLIVEKGYDLTWTTTFFDSRVVVNDGRKELNVCCHIKKMTDKEKRDFEDLQK